MATIQQPVAALRKQLEAVAPYAAPVVDVANALLGFGDGRAVQLSRMEQKLDVGRDLPWGRGMALLRVAIATPHQSSQILLSAAESFEEAHDLYNREPAYSFWAALIAATINGTLGRGTQSRRLAAQSYKEAVEAVYRECREANLLSAGRRKTVMRVVTGLGLLAAGLLGPSIAVLAKRSGAVPIVGWILPFVVLVAVGVVLLRMGTFSEMFAQHGLEERLNGRLLNAYDLADTVCDIHQIATSLGVDQAALPLYVLQVGEVRRTGDFDYRLNYVPCGAHQFELEQSTPTTKEEREEALAQKLRKNKSIVEEALAQKWRKNKSM